MFTTEDMFNGAVIIIMIICAALALVLCTGFAKGDSLAGKILFGIGFAFICAICLVVIHHVVTHLMAGQAIFPN